MKPENKIDEILDRYITSASAEDVESHCDRMLQKLQTRDLRTKPNRNMYWNRLALAAAAAGIVLAVFMGLWWRAGAPAVLESEGSRKIEFGEVVRARSAGVSTLNLADGSRVEMRAGSELFLERAEDGVRIRLNSGDLIVNAAKQHGHLYVQTRDIMVSVIGTVFLVKAEAEGSRVAVIEGEVRVQQEGTAEKKLLPGEQVSSNPSMKSQPVSHEISWSRNSEALLAQLPQSAITPRTSPANLQTSVLNSKEERLMFEVASVRPSDPGTPGGRGTEGGSRVTISTGPCKGGGTVQLDPRRFVVTGATLYYLITAAYGMGSCLATTDLISGGPDWIGSDRFDIQASMPEGSTGYTRDQFNNGQAPELQMRLRTLLVERFKLALRREMKEMPIYILEVAKGGPKLTPWKEGEFYTHRHATALPYYIEGGKASMSDLADLLRIATGRTVLDRTGVTGEFNYDLSFAPLNTGLMRRLDSNDPSLDTRPSVFAVLEDEFKLKLRESKAPVEVLVIDRVEKLSEN